MRAAAVADCPAFGGDRRIPKAFKIPRSYASFAAIASSRAVRSVPSIVFFSRSSALLSGVRNKDLALQPFDQRSLGLRNSLVSILSFLGGSLDEFGLSDFILIFIFPHFPPSRPKLSAYGLRPIANNFGLPGRNVGNNYLNKASFVLSLSGGLWRKHSRSRIVLSEFNHTALT